MRSHRISAAVSLIVALGCGCGTSTVGRAVGPGLVEADAPEEAFECSAPADGDVLEPVECEAVAAPFRDLVLALAEAHYSGDGLAERYVSADAPFTEGRLSAPDEGDFAMPVSRAEALRAQDQARAEADQAEDPASHALLRLSGTRRGDRAELEGVWMTYWGAAEDQYRVGFSAELVRTGDGWRFGETRTYMAGSYYIGGPGEFDATFYETLDAQVEAARARQQAEPSIDHRRLVRDALQGARLLPAAFELAQAIAAEQDATAQDHAAVAELAHPLGQLDIERRARIAQLDAPMGDLRAYASRQRCPNEAPWDYPPPPGDDEEYDETAPEPCMYEELARAHAESGAPRDLVVIRITRGHHPEQTVALLGAHEGRWEHLAWLGDGSSGSEADVRTFEVSDLELRQLEPGGPLEALARYDARFPLEGRSVHAEGYIACLDLRVDDARCARVPTLEEGQASAGSVARATVTFGEGTVTTTAVRGPYSRARGERPLEHLFGDEDRAGGH